MFSWSWGFGSRRRLPGPAGRAIRLVVGIGLVVLMGVSLGPGSYPGMHIGSVVPALDSGDFSNVFPRHGSDSWLFDLAEGVLGICLIGQTIWTWAKRRRAADRTTAGSGYPGAGPSDPGMASSPIPM